MPMMEAWHVYHSENRRQVCQPLLHNHVALLLLAYFGPDPDPDLNLTLTHTTAAPAASAVAAFPLLSL